MICLLYTSKAKGVSDGTHPTVNITREQLVTMLYRYAGSPKANGSLNSFSDAARDVYKRQILPIALPTTS